MAALLLFIYTNASAQLKHSENSIPRLVHKDGRYALLVDGAPYLMLGAQSNNSSDWPATLPKVWSAIEYLHANTLETPIYWEQLEPKPGKVDYSAVDLLLNQARQHHRHLVLLWFGTWKNGSQHYMPEWMKLDPKRYFRVVNKEGEYVDSPSPFATASLEEDKKAFAALMKHLKETDSERTVLMVQVENETGTWGGTTRDYSPEANKLFEAPVPAEVLEAMGKPSLTPGANWETVFGPEAEVYFHAWAIAKYVGQVAAAGKAIYPLPMYVNAALHDPLTPEVPVNYESGGPTDNVISIWKAEAPAIDIEAPDIYLPGTEQYLKTLEAYHRQDNALFIPETFGSNRSARFFFSALGLQAIGYSPFGMDYTRARPTPDEPDWKSAVFEPTAENYRLIAPMMREIAKLNYEGKMQATAELDDGSPQILHFGEWDAVVTYKFRHWPMENGNQKHGPLGRALVAQLGANQFLVTGMDCSIDFRPAGTPEQQKTGGIVFGTGQEPSAKIDGEWIHRQFLRVEEGHYENGVFKFERILNGDQTDYGLQFTSAPEVLHVSLATY